MSGLLGYVFGSPDAAKKKNDEAAESFRKEIGAAGRDSEGTFVHFLTDGCLKLKWRMRRLVDSDSNEVAGLILAVKPLRFYPPKTPAQTNLIRLSYIRFASVARALCEAQDWQLEFELVDTILHEILRPTTEFDGKEGSGAWKFRKGRLPFERTDTDLQTNMAKAQVNYDKQRIGELGCEEGSKEGSKPDSSKDGKNSEGKSVTVARKPFYMCRRRRPYWSSDDPGRIVVLGRAGTSAAADDLRRRFPDKEVHVRKWGASANSFLRENPLTSRNRVEVYGAGRASRASLERLERGSRRGADLSVHY
ncbi:hypothetical protein KFL_002190310 [Klebsormidium nitens]|uniref:Uncharacterized protein n=1 Tax=Klebsormidium nitens TaxID=105231 RepID=A0A1Y1IAE9_KLENI|nr:hypothetical protein KFL_002190310 [Klebsormidium nitens]|eukprot:GAQ85078.1 hypothetical protein KFL_002190310 [Klebsormidium nitens]